MRWDFFRELGRKVFHLFILIVLAGYLIIEKNIGKTAALMVLASLLIIFLILEYIRLELQIKIPVIDYLIRPRENDRLSGVIYFLIATIICLAIFNFRIALAALLMATFGDMAAAIIGHKYGRIKIFKKKSIAGGLSELIINIIIGIIVLTNHFGFSVIIVMAFAAAAVEIFVENIDDNLAVPLLAGFIGQLLIMI
jgi:dolichol kinase